MGNKEDKINPNHYKKYGKEVIDLMVDIWGIQKVISFCEMNSFKYRMRAGDKEGQDLEIEISKARYYEQKAEFLTVKKSPF